MLEYFYIAVFLRLMKQSEQKYMGTVINIKYRLQIVNGNNPLFIMLFPLKKKKSLQ